MSERRCYRIGYDTREQALADAKFIHENNRLRTSACARGQNRARPYQCPKCQQWHLSSQSNARNKKLRRRQRRINNG